MKGAISWSHGHYTPPLFDGGDIYVNRIVPFTDGFSFEWDECPHTGSYHVFWRERGVGEYNEAVTSGTKFTLGGLVTGGDYEFYVTADDKKSRVRLARPGVPPGTVVNYLHPEDNAYSFSGHALCSPSLVRHPDGFLLASMDVYSGNMPQNLAIIFRSDDDGETWYHYNELFPCFWPRLFIYRSVLYCMAVSTEYGDLLIGRSVDGGQTFGVPTVLLRGSGRVNENGCHRNPVRFCEYNGRLWTALEYGCWAKGDHAVMMASVGVNDDLLDVNKWLFTEPVPYNPNWPGVAKGKAAGCIEGNTIPSPDGSKLYNILRYNLNGSCTPKHSLAMVMRVNPDDPEAPLEYDRVIHFPGNHSKFEITPDPVSGKYISIISRILGDSSSHNRNLLSLAVSDNLFDWHVCLDLHDYTDCNPSDVGMQYISYIIEGDDLLYLSRTAISGARNFHDANYSTFHRLENFRQYLDKRA